MYADSVFLKISLQFLHMVSSAYLTGFFEIIKHDMTREEAGIYVKQLLIQAIGEPGIYADFVNGRKRADHWKIAE